MVLTIAILMAGAGLLGVLALARRVAMLEAMQQSLEQARNSAAPALENVEPKPLQGLSIALEIEQDHPHSPFVALLTRHLDQEDVLAVNLGSRGDIVIKGALSCNGYTDVYFSADISCFVKGDPICTVIERPPHGDRPINLSTELIAKLKRELLKVQDQTERRQAINELS
jgi:hypothetical protein